MIVATLALASCGGVSGRAAGNGITVTAPPGWHLRIVRGAVEAASRPLPRQSGSVAAELSRALGHDDLAVVLFEDTPDSQWSPPLEFAVYRAGRPRPFAARDFAGPPFGGDNPGHHSYARRNFTIAGRYFDLFVEASAMHPAPRRIAELNRLVDSLRIRAGDFYPGGADPARFQPAPGWRTRSIGTIPAGTSMLSVTVSSTIPYVDPLDTGAPERTIARLDRDDILIQVRLDAENRGPPPRRATKLRLGEPGPCSWGEGPPTHGVACAGGSSVVPAQYTASVVVVYGQPQPTPAQRARAQAELDRLVLPHWAHWD